MASQKRNEAGPPRRGRGKGVLARLQPDRLAAIDAWIAEQDAPMTRPQAIRAMLDAVLVIVAKAPSAKSAKKARTR
jgi:hypothetical protein